MEDFRFETYQLFVIFIIHVTFAQSYGQKGFSVFLILFRFTISGHVNLRRSSLLSNSKQWAGPKKSCGEAHGALEARQTDFGGLS